MVNIWRTYEVNNEGEAQCFVPYFKIICQDIGR